MPMRISNPEARVMQYCNDFFKRLESVGCASFRKRHPKKTVQILCSRLYPHKLRAEMKRRIDYNEQLIFDVKGFIRFAKEQAVRCQTYEVNKHRVPPPSTPKIPPTDDKTPICLWEPHKKKGFHHLPKDCKRCPKAEKDILFDELRKNKTQPSATRQVTNKKHSEIENSVLKQLLERSYVLRFAQTSAPTITLWTRGHYNDSKTTTS